MVVEARSSRCERFNTMAQQIQWDGKTWQVERLEFVWIFTGQLRKGSWNAPTMQLPIADAPTFEDVIPALDARQLAKLNAEQAQYLASKRVALSTTPALVSRRSGYAPAGTTNADTSEVGRCDTCGRGGSYWNPGAGRHLCRNHWDEY